MNNLNINKIYRINKLADSFSFFFRRIIWLQILDINQGWIIWSYLKQCDNSFDDSEMFYLVSPMNIRLCVMAINLLGPERG